MRDVIVVRRCRDGCYRLADPEGGLLGCAPRFVNLVRFVAQSGASVRFERPREEPRGLVDRLRSVFRPLLRR